MARSSAATVEAYLEELPAERRAVVAALRDRLVRSLPAGYQETMNWGMISYEIPLARYPRTYNGQPLSYIALAAQKSHYALYLMGAAMDPVLSARLAEAFRSAGKRLDMGKSCLRFRRLEDLPLEAIEEVVAALPPARLIELYEAGRAS